LVNSKKIAVVSGGFDPLHSGHLAYIEEAKKLGDKLVVCLNSDEWLTKKKGKPFLPFSERYTIMSALINVDEVQAFDDSDGSCIDGLVKIKERYPSDNIIFCNGGDRHEGNIPELALKDIEFKFRVGGSNKLNSSSEILTRWHQASVERSWGHYDVLFERNELKVKELIVLPKNGMSFQRHFSREEYWFIFEGSCKVFFKEAETETVKDISLVEGDYFYVPKLSWHQITNPYNEVCKIIEVQRGEAVIEHDIERLFYYPETPQKY